MYWNGVLEALLITLAHPVGLRCVQGACMKCMHSFAWMGWLRKTTARVLVCACVYSNCESQALVCMATPAPIRCGNCQYYFVREPPQNCITRIALLVNIRSCTDKALQVQPNLCIPSAFVVFVKDFFTRQGESACMGGLRMNPRGSRNPCRAGPGQQAEAVLSITPRSYQRSLSSSRHQNTIAFIARPVLLPTCACAGRLSEVVMLCDTAGERAA